MPTKIDDEVDTMTRTEIADLIMTRLEHAEAAARNYYAQTEGSIGYFVVDDLLPVDLAAQIFKAFPAPHQMKVRKSLREYKFIAAQMNEYDSILEETIFAFQDERLVKKMGEICGVEGLHPDHNLYAGGISLMGRGQFLNPHLDNSHDKDREKWRVFNLLYYVSPKWNPLNGGNLELWPGGVKGSPITISSVFNRLVVMATHQGSWHSVSPIYSDATRCCVSNYYFSGHPLKSNDQFHVTSFRGRPNQKVRDLVLRADIALRQGVRKVFPKGVVETDHVYKKDV